MIPSLRPFLVLVLTLATTSVTPSLADDSNDAPDINKILGGQNGEVCRPYTCPKTYAPLPKWPLSIESAGCQGGMQQAKGMDFKHFEKCCDLQTMCYQVCGMTKEKCDADMEACMKKSCDELPGLAASYEEKQDLTEEEVAEESESCHRMVGLVKLIRGMNGCREYEMFQMRNCECVAKDKLVANMERVLRNFYKKYKPDGIGKVDSLVAKADGKTSNFAIILKQLITKYPAAIKRKKVEPRPPKKMMNDEL